MLSMSLYISLVIWRPSNTKRDTHWSPSSTCTHIITVYTSFTLLSLMVDIATTEIASNPLTCAHLWCLPSDTSLMLTFSSRVMFVSFISSPAYHLRLLSLICEKPWQTCPISILSCFYSNHQCLFAGACCDVLSFLYIVVDPMVVVVM